MTATSWQYYDHIEQSCINVFEINVENTRKKYLQQRRREPNWLLNELINSLHLSVHNELAIRPIIANM